MKKNICKTLLIASLLTASAYALEEKGTINPQDQVKCKSSRNLNLKPNMTGIYEDEKGNRIVIEEEGVTEWPRSSGHKDLFQNIDQQESCFKQKAIKNKMILEVASKDEYVKDIDQRDVRYLRFEKVLVDSFIKKYKTVLTISSCTSRKRNFFMAMKRAFRNSIAFHKDTYQCPKGFYSKIVHPRGRFGKGWEIKNITTYTKVSEL